MTRLVLDSSCLRGCSQSVLRVLHSRGYQISVSAIALMEFWANAVRGGDIARFRARFRNVASYMNPLDPVVPTGIQLLARLGARVDGSTFVRPDTSYDARVRIIWQHLMHLADEVILVTSDLNLMERVDLTGSFQAPYVRTLGEVFFANAPEGPPWGRQARRAAKTHRQRERTSLVRLEKQMTESLSELANPQLNLTCASHAS